MDAANPTGASLPPTRFSYRSTVEGLTGAHLHPLQDCFDKHVAAQCGFCTPGILMTLIPFLRDHPAPTEPEIRDALSGHLCRCTGYANIIAAVQRVVKYQAAR